MKPDLTELCRQLRLAHVVDYVAQQQDEQTHALVEQLLLLNAKDGVEPGWENSSNRQASRI